MKTDPKQKAMELLAGALMLFLALYGTAFSFLTVFQPPADYGAVSRACFVLTAYFTLAFSLPRFWQRAIGVALVGAGLGFLAWESTGALVMGAMACARQVAELFITSFSLSLTADFSPWLDGVGLAELSGYTTLFFNALLTLLGLWLGWVVVRRRSYWLSFWATFPFLLLALANTVTPDWLPLCMLLLFWGVGLLARLTGRSDPYGSAKTVLCTLPLALCLLMGLRLALPPAEFQREDWTEQLRLELTDFMAMAGRDQVNAGGAGGILGVGSGAEVDLSQAGPLDFNGDTVLRVQAETSGRIYLRGFSAARYGADGWEQLTDGEYAQLAKEATPPEGSLDFSSARMISPLSSASTLIAGVGEDWGGVGSYQPLNFPAMAEKNTPSSRFIIENVGAPSGYVYTPYQLVSPPERMSGAQFIHDAYLARGTGVWKHILYARDRANPELGSRVAGPGEREELSYRAFVKQYYLQVPVDLEPGLMQILSDAGLTAAVTSDPGETPVPISYFMEDSARARMTMARMVAGYLEELAVYDPETPVTPAGEDFTMCFLTETRRGYCMHFASAATLLLRTMGVPARYVSGYVADVTAGEKVEVPDYNAHAWVEVYCDGYGWQPVEVTPGFDGDFPWERQEGGNVVSTPKPSETPKPSQTPKPSAPQPTRTPAPEQVKEEAGSILGWWLLAPVAVLLLLAAFLLRRSLARRGRERAFRGGDNNAAALELYGYALRILAFAGRAEDVDAAAEALAKKARFSQHTLTAEERETVRAWAEGLAAETDGALPWYKKLLFRYVYGLF